MRLAISGHLLLHTFFTMRWNCTKFADFIRGEKKPFSLPIGTWQKYCANLRKRKPVRYFISEVLLAKLQKIYNFPSVVFNQFKNYIYNRFYRKTHYLQTGLEPGYYYEFEQRILCGLFNTFVIFCETEFAYCVENSKKYKWENGRSPEAFFAYIEWCKNLGDESPEQCAHAFIIEDLYNWWTVRRKEKEDRLSEDYDHELEEEYFRECDMMMIKLIKINRCLWT